MVSSVLWETSLDLVAILFLMQPGMLLVLLCHKGTLLAHIQLLIYQVPRGLFRSAAFQLVGPSMCWCKVIPAVCGTWCFPLNFMGSSLLTLPVCFASDWLYNHYPLIQCLAKFGVQTTKCILLHFALKYCLEMCILLWQYSFNANCFFVMNLSLRLAST